MNARMRDSRASGNSARAAGGMCSRPRKTSLRCLSASLRRRASPPWAHGYNSPSFARRRPARNPGLQKYGRVWALQAPLAHVPSLSSRSALSSLPSCVMTLGDPSAANGSNWVVDEDERDESDERDGRVDGYRWSGTSHLATRHSSLVPARRADRLRRNAKIWKSREDAEEGLESTSGSFPHPDLPPPFLRGTFAPSRLPKAPVPTSTSGTSKE